ncbi:MAG: ARM repeat-containing protein [Aureobasidium pullulans]|nr:MAG: ARM repeat-containing protein [Aureobasidium pullulans]
MMQQNPADESFAHLSRLSQKAGVQATLILSRETGAIVRSSGLVSRDDSSNAESTLPASNGLTDDRTDGAMPNAEHVAEVVWKFAKAAGDMLQELSNSPDDDVRLLRLRSKNKSWKFAKAAGDMLQELSNSPDDDVRLLRLRSKNKEYVIFPDAKFIAVAIHNTPPA